MEPLGVRFATADEWNASVPIGARVEYYPRGLGHPEHREATTSSVAWTNTRGTPLVRLTGKPVGVPLSRLQLL